ncbi:NADH-quinone oxidoreductase subunit M domain protein [Mycobacterium xenopi 4042]|uniref:NADH-quinone oxidoreductase subunit M domain protein n=1 Tax=Mycobacterium xenopi 4042 TaxID=1299334 RepID=X7ZVW5_MYCXE|nr:NADH-quinone oxidoreductase subunit M domain protein [Mycobacterium xenopi 4042]
MLMMAVMDKVGTFGMLRYCLQLFPARQPISARRSSRWPWSGLSMGRWWRSARPTLCD